MADPRVYTDPTHVPNRLQAGIISRIRLENFMCHSNLEIELGDWVNFVTGQNGSGFSILSHAQEWSPPFWDYASHLGAGLVARREQMQ
ncbi:UNVERIFIED_CONTAM: Structural maintenance of chromosomes protein 6A [Sesamum angustifolium]|uniref:Structural maintenance of chromosomes protein 6A n=1 Tax=Sesamum angustifolium TaxID=2727405 RepID=A0AAW2LET5_9LAMI